LSNRIQLYADDLLQILGPTDEKTYPIAAITTVTSCTGRLYEDTKDATANTREGVLNVDAAAAAATLTLIATARFLAGDTVEVDLDDGTLHQTTIASVTDATVLVLTAGLASAAKKGRGIRRRFHPIGATTLEVSGGLGSQYELGDAIEVRQDDGTLHETTVSNRHADYLVLGDAITVAVSCGQRIARKLGADITMTIFNSAGALPHTDDWGYQGTIADTHAGLKAGMKVRAEITLVDDDGGATVLLETVRGVVVGAG